MKKEWPEEDCEKGHKMNWLGACYFVCCECKTIFVSSNYYRLGSNKEVLKAKSVFKHRETTGVNV